MIYLLTNVAKTQDVLRDGTIREFKQIATATSTTAAGSEKAPK